jgi:hypothetical protein
MEDLVFPLIALFAFIAIASAGTRQWASALAFIGLASVLTTVSFLVR